MSTQDRRTVREQLEALVREQIETHHSDTNNYCWWCMQNVNGIDYPKEPHTDGCWLTRALAALRAHPPATPDVNALWFQAVRMALHDDEPREAHEIFAALLAPSPAVSVAPLAERAQRCYERLNDLSHRAPDKELRQAIYETEMVLWDIVNPAVSVAEPEQEQEKD
jgi:hypothetical protein